jgi:hypothetical protein
MIEASSEKAVHRDKSWFAVFIEPPRAIRAVIAVGVLVFLFGWGAACVVRAISKPGDYYKYVAMGTGVIQGFNPYDTDEEKRRWPPFLALAYAPLAVVDHVSPAASRIFFLLLSYWAFYDAIKVVAGRIYGKKLSIWPRSGRIGLTEPAIALAVLLCARYLSDSARYIQPTFVLLWLSARSLALLESGKDGKAGLLAGFAISVKLTPLVWVGYFIFRGRWKAAAAALIWTAVFFAAPFAVLGPATARQYYDSWLSADKIYARIPTRASNESVFAMFERWVGDSLAPWAGSDPLARFGLGGDPWIFSLTLFFLCILGAAWILCAGDAFRYRRVSDSAPARARRIIEEGLILNLALYSSPLSWKHYYMVQVYLLLGIFAVLAWDLARRSTRSKWVLILIVVGFILQSNLWIPFMGAGLAERIQEQSLILWGSLLYFTAGSIYVRSLPDAQASTQLS